MKNYTGRIGHLAKTAGKYNIFDLGLSHSSPSAVSYNSKQQQQLLIWFSRESYLYWQPAVSTASLDGF